MPESPVFRCKTVIKSFHNARFTYFSVQTGHYRLPECPIILINTKQLPISINECSSYNDSTYFDTGGSSLNGRTSELSKLQ